MPRPSKFTQSDKSGKRTVVEGIRRVNAFLPEDVFKKLRMMAVESDMTISEVLMEAIKAYRPKSKQR